MPMRREDPTTCSNSRLRLKTSAEPSMLRDVVMPLHHRCPPVSVSGVPSRKAPKAANTYVLRLNAHILNDAPELPDNLSSSGLRR